MLEGHKENGTLEKREQIKMTICNWCGIESKSDVVCDWCKRPLNLRANRYGSPPLGGAGAAAVPVATQRFGTDYLKDTDDDPNIFSPRNLVIGAVALIGLFALIAIFLMIPTSGASKSAVAQVGEGSMSPDPSQTFTPYQPATNSPGFPVYSTPPKSSFVPRSGFPEGINLQGGTPQNPGQVPTVIKNVGPLPYSTDNSLKVSTVSLRLVPAGKGKVRLVGRFSINNQTGSSMVDYKIFGTFGKNNIPLECFEGDMTKAKLNGPVVVPADTTLDIQVVSAAMTGRPGRPPRGTIRINGILDGGTGTVGAEVGVP